MPIVHQRSYIFFFNDTATTEIYTLSLHDALPIVAVPVPGPNEVLARVRAVSICGTDAHLIHGDYPGFWPPAFPFIPGHEWAGEIAALGPGAERYGWAVGAR